MSEEDWLFLFTSLVAPRPIAWVSSVSASGVSNLAPYSSYTAVADDPPVLFLAAQRRPSGERKHTAKNILATSECVINVVDATHAERMALTAADVEGNEFMLAGVREESCTAISSPRVGGSAASFECRLREHHVVARVADCFFLSVVNVWVRGAIVSSLTPEVVESVKCVSTIGACGIEQYMTADGMIAIRNPV